METLKKEAKKNSAKKPSLPKPNPKNEKSKEGKVEDAKMTKKRKSRSHSLSKSNGDVLGGLQLKKSQALREHPSRVKVGGISRALIDIPSATMNQLHPKKQIDVNEPVFPTQSRINRVQEKYKGKNTFSMKIGRHLANFDLWATQNVPHADVLAFNVCVTIAPILFIVTIWDLLAVMIFYIPHMSFLNLPGFLYPFYPIGTIASFYGYMMRFLMEDYSKKTYICYAGVIIYPSLLVSRCLLHYFFNEYRTEMKLWY